MNRKECDEYIKNAYFAGILFGFLFAGLVYTLIFNLTNTKF